MHDLSAKGLGTVLKNLERLLMRKIVLPMARGLFSTIHPVLKLILHIRRDDQSCPCCQCCCFYNKDIVIKII